MVLEAGKLRIAMPRLFGPPLVCVLKNANSYPAHDSDSIAPNIANAQTPLLYVLALACYLLIPAVPIDGAGLFHLIDPEMARGHADYVRDYRLLELARLGALIAAEDWRRCK